MTVTTKSMSKKKSGPRTINEYKPYSDVLAQGAKLRAELAALEAELDELRQKYGRNIDGAALDEQARTLLAGGTIENLEVGRSRLKELTERRDVLARAVQLHQKEVAIGPLKGEASRAVCQNLGPEQQQLAADILKPAADLAAAIRAAAEFQERLWRDECTMVNPLRDISLPQQVDVLDAIAIWLASHTEYAKGK